MLTIHEATFNGLRCLKLAGELTIYTASDARRNLRAALEHQGAPSELDLSGIEELDTAGMQVLLWFKQEASAQGKVVAFTNHSSAVIEVIDLLKIAGVFGDPILITPTSR